MSEHRDSDASIRRISTIAALVISAAVVAIPYASFRAYHRWVRENSPFSGLRNHLVRLRIHSQDRREAARALLDVARAARGES